ncbi:MAG TPA: cell division protein FtsQ/DivIB [Methyloversatilis sp.]
MAKKAAKRKPARLTPEDRGLWDSPRALTMIADVILLLASTALGYALVIVVTRMPVLPLQAVTLTHAPAHLSTAQIEDAARRAVTGNFLTTDIDRARTVFEGLPWVRCASVRRVWPGSIEVDLEEHDAVARWWIAENTPPRMVNRHGELFTADHEPSLPLFVGPDEQARNMLEHLDVWSKALSPLQRRIEKIVLTRREAWQLQLDDGSRLELGREDEKQPIAQRLARYVTTQPEVVRKSAQKIIYADLRYPNGYAIRMNGTEHQDRP